MLGVVLFLAAIYFYFSSHRYVSIIILFALVSGTFQLMPISLMAFPAIGVKKTYDWVLLYVAAIALFRPQIFLDLQVWKRFRIFILYGSFLLVLLFYSIYVRGVEVSVSIRVFRGFIYFITLFLFVPLSTTELKKVFQFIIIFTTVASVIYCLQLAMNATFLNNVSASYPETKGDVDRYYNLPVFIYPVIFFLFFGNEVFELKSRHLLLVINSAAILLSQHRNLILSVIICYLLYVLINKGFKLRNLAFYSIIGVGLLAAANNILSDRFTKGFQDISKTTIAVSSINFYEVKLSELSTTEFRQLLLLERLDFILKDNSKTMFGIGLITEDSKKAKALRFNVGMTDGYGDVTQVDSSDIAWSVLLLQLGLGGTIIFILFNLSFLVKFISKRNDSYLQVGILYIVCLFMTSFYSNTISLPYVTTLLMLFGAYYYNLYKNKFNYQEDGNS